MLMSRNHRPNPSSSILAAATDRRLHPRHDGAGLQVEIAGKVHPVVDISTGGICVHGLDRKVGERFMMVLSRVGHVNAVSSECEVVSRDGALVHMAFTRPTLPLLRQIVAHVASITGISPHLLKDA